MEDNKLQDSDKRWLIVGFVIAALMYLIIAIIAFLRFLQIHETKYSYRVIDIDQVSFVNKLDQQYPANVPFLLPMNPHPGQKDIRRLAWIPPTLLKKSH